MQENAVEILQVDISDEMEQSFIDYAFYVNKDRALPDVRDGLKPVHRRILNATYLLGLTPDKPYKKSARIIGEVLGKFHPHGDTSVYDAMVRMAQPWSMRYPLIDGQGNFGNIDGDGAAAMRYTEARLSKTAMTMMEDIKKSVVDFKPNFSEDEVEPTVLPSRLPNLLLNGTIGIGVAMASSFAPHNIQEVVSAVVAQIKNPDITVEELHTHILGPDFPTGGTIINQNELLNAYKTGRGRARIRAKYTVEKIGRKEVLVFTEIPYGVAKEKLIENIAELVNSKKVEGISDLRDASNRHGLRIEVDIKKDSNPDIVANHLFKHSKLEDTFSINHVCLVDGEPKLIGLKQMIEEYIKHQQSVLRRRSQFDLDKASARLHLIEGLLVALEDIDNVIAIIKSSKTAAIAVSSLGGKYNLSEVQAKAIVEMRLRRLTNSDKMALEQEHKDLVELVKELKNIISNIEALNNKLIEELLEVLSQYKDNRLSSITNIIVKPEEKDIQFVQPEDVVVIMTQAGNIKKIPAKSFKVQNRNGKGIKNQDDVILDVIRTNTVDNLMIFTSLGKMYRLIVDQIPTGTNASRGVSIHTLVKMEEHDKAMAITSLKRQSQAEYVLSVSELGMVKKTKIAEYASTKRSGIAAVGLKEGDSISTITFINNEQLLLITEKGMSIRFNTSSITPVGRTAIGVRGMKVADGDRIVSALPVNKDTDDVAIFTSHGLGKRTPLKDFPVQGRDGKGTISYKPTDATGLVVSASLVEDKDNILVVGESSSICISAKSLPVLGKGSVGNIVIKNNDIISVTKI